MKLSQQVAIHHNQITFDRLESQKKRNLQKETIIVNSTDWTQTRFQINEAPEADKINEKFRRTVAYS
jgi:hypothetical protein